MLLAQLLKRDNNNLDLVRLIAACLVIYGHANAIVRPEVSGGDWVASLLVFDYSGSLAVKVFFFLSGLVVANSLLEKNNLLYFFIARAFRIIPGFFVVLIGSAFFLGPAISTQPFFDYVSNSQTLRYVWGGLLMQVNYDLPGVFKENPISAVNGSLWSIPYEVGAYWLLASVFALSVHRCRALAVALVVFVILDPLLPQRILSNPIPNPEIDSLAPCFAFGALLALFKHDIKITPKLIFGMLVLFFVFKSKVYAHYFFYGALFFGLLYFFSRPILIAMRPRVDISYGVYLWGWPLQQSLVHFFPEMGVQLHRFVAIGLACGAGWISWSFIEEPFVRWARLCYDRLNSIGWLNNGR